jgi:phosphoribosyl 1,2-cyclic phosphodiesterase
MSEEVMSEETTKISVYFWGTRGSTPVNSPDHRIFGGNTSCVEVRHGAGRVICDGGSGLVGLSDSLLEEGAQEIDIFFSHVHADHICGLPFFKPLFVPGYHVRLHSFDATPDALEKAITGYISQPLFPIDRSSFQAEVTFHSHDAKRMVNCAGFQISALPIPHPGGAHALKVSAANRHFVYATDTEHQPGAPNTDLIAFMQHADLAVYDCTYDDDEFEGRIGWGHSTWQEGVRLAQAAKLRRFGIFHHEPGRTDEQLAAIEAQAKDMFEASFVTRDFSGVDI